MYKCGYISIVGKPNVGKSSLINAIIGEKVSIVSQKAQTTRNNILGILNGEDFQYIFVDTPGMHKSKSGLDKYMNKSVRSSLDGVDVIVYVIDVTRPYDDDLEYVKNLVLKNSNIIVALSKVDISSYEKVYPIIAKITAIKEIKAIVPFSSLKKYNLDIILSEIAKLIPQSESKDFPFPQDLYTDKSVRFLVKEIIREKTLLYLDEEVPHGIAVDIKDFKETDKLTTIFADIVCERSAHKNIIIGKNGQMIKKIGGSSREDIEKLLDTKVLLKLWVREKKNWKDNASLLADLGYSSEEI